MRALVTGGTGFIGSNIMHQLLEDGWEVVITGHDAEQPVPKGVTYLQYGFTGLNYEKIGKVDAVFHQAAINDTRYPDRDIMLAANYEASKQLFEEVVKNGCKRIVYATSTATYGNSPAPYVEGVTKVDLTTPYAESKHLLDEFAMEFAKQHPDVIVVGLKYCNVYGPRENHKGRRANMIYHLAQQIKKGNPKLFTDGSQKRDHIYVKDVVRANILAATNAQESCIVHCGAGIAVTFNRLVEILNDVLGFSREIEYIPNPYIGNYQDHTECNMEKAKEMIGFVPEYSIEAGIKDYFESGWLVSKE